MLAMPPIPGTTRDQDQQAAHYALCVEDYLEAFRDCRVTFSASYDRFYTEYERAIASRSVDSTNVSAIEYPQRRNLRLTVMLHCAVRLMFEGYPNRPGSEKVILPPGIPSLYDFIVYLNLFSGRGRVSFGADGAPLFANKVDTPDPLRALTRTGRSLSESPDYCICGSKDGW